MTAITCRSVSVLLVGVAASVVLGCFPETSSAAKTSFGAHKVYRVMDIGKPGVPKLTKAQTRWLHEIERSAYYSKHIAELYFSPVPSFTKPLIVFQDTMSGEYWVIGDSCNAMYHYRDSEVSIMENDCGHPL